MTYHVPDRSPTALMPVAADPSDRTATIAAIRRLNPTAAAGFLAEFRTEALKDYLEHLRHAKHKHVRLAGWLQRKTAAKRMAA